MSVIDDDLTNENVVDVALLDLDLCHDDVGKLAAWARRYGRPATTALRDQIDEIDELRFQLEDEEEEGDDEDEEDKAA
ncbi:MAG TPA: hypothetical protein VG248_03550 [Caulobacteraceae bacterium]|jgi:hypothetical protein|nr:hypothetical protein [Caulobacteraceae bacterium]